MATTTTKAAAPASALEPIDRLEEKIKLLVSVIGRLRGEQTRVVEENARLQREVEALRGRLTDAEGAASELGTLRDERDQIRSRVSEMLQQLDALNL
jgi:regulator of replication initiation timing